MDKADATRHLGKLRRQWFAKRKGIGTLLKEAVTKQESALTDSDSLNKAQDVDDALQELGGDHCSFGQFTLTVTVWAEDGQKERSFRTGQRPLEHGKVDITFADFGRVSQLNFRTFPRMSSDVRTAGAPYRTGC